MSTDNLGYACCAHCGAEFRLFTIFNRDMQGLCRSWKERHERTCAKRTPQSRMKWARPYLGKDQYESSVVINLDHPGMRIATTKIYHSAEHWFEELLAIATNHDNVGAIRDFDGWTDGWAQRTPEDVYFAEFPEHKSIG